MLEGRVVPRRVDGPRQRVPPLRLRRSLVLRDDPLGRVAGPRRSDHVLERPLERVHQADLGGGEVKLKLLPEQGSHLLQLSGWRSVSGKGASHVSQSLWMGESASRIELIVRALPVPGRNEQSAHATLSKGVQVGVHVESHDPSSEGPATLADLRSRASTSTPSRRLRGSGGSERPFCPTASESSSPPSLSSGSQRERSSGAFVRLKEVASFIWCAKDRNPPPHSELSDQRRPAFVSAAVMRLFAFTGLPKATLGDTETVRTPAPSSERMKGKNRTAPRGPFDRFSSGRR